MTSRELIIKKAKELSVELNNSSLSCSEFARQTGIKREKIYELFPEGGWTEVAKIANLNTRGPGYPLSVVIYSYRLPKNF